MGEDHAGRTFDDPRRRPLPPEPRQENHDASVSSHHHIISSIDVGGASFVTRVSVEKQIIRIAVEPTGGYEKPLVKALRGAGLPVEMVHMVTPTASWSNLALCCLRTLIGAKAKSEGGEIANVPVSILRFTLNMVSVRVAAPSDIFMIVNDNYDRF
jgi:hypothetical protein